MKQRESDNPLIAPQIKICRCRWQVLARTCQSGLSWRVLERKRTCKGDRESHVHDPKLTYVTRSYRPISMNCLF